MPGSGQNRNPHQRKPDVQQVLFGLVMRLKRRARHIGPIGDHLNRDVGPIVVLQQTDQSPPQSEGRTLAAAVLRVGHSGHLSSDSERKGKVMLCAGNKDQRTTDV